MMKYLLLQHEWKNAEMSKSLNNIKTKVRKIFDDEELEGKAKDKCFAYVEVLLEMKEVGELSNAIGFSCIILGDD